MTLVVGLTGGIGSGKTAVSDRFAKLGIDIIDADIIARQVVEPGSPALENIYQHFGQTVILDTGELNRSQLRQIIFEEPQQKHWLENLLHPLIREAINKQLATVKSAYCLLVAPLLLEGDLHKTVDKILVIDCSTETQIKRAIERDNTDSKAIMGIIAQQMPREERLQKADFFINNEGSLTELYQRVDKLHQQLLTLTK